MPAPSSLTVLLDRLYILLASPIIFIRMLLDFISYSIPALRPSKTWTVEQAVRMRIVRYLIYAWPIWRAGDKLHLRPGAEKNRFTVIKPADTKLYQGALASESKIVPLPLGAVWTPSRPPTSGLIGKSLTVALHFHGGAFCIGNGRDEDTGWLARNLIKHMGVSHVLTPGYRLSSSKGGHHPAPFQDAVTCYLYLTRELGIPASQIVFSGDSAGGTTALGLLRYIQEHGEQLGIEAPAGVALWSPWVSASAAKEQDVRESPNYATDYISREFGWWGADTITDFGRLDVTQPYLSPVLHPFEVAGRKIPLFIQAGEKEILHDLIVEFSDKFGKLSGWEIELEVLPDCPHDTILLGPRAGFHKETVVTIEKARVFFKRETELALWHEPLQVLC